VDAIMLKTYGPPKVKKARKDKNLRKKNKE
jgi:hypothetical protein